MGAGRGGGKVLNPAISSFPAIPWLVKVSPGLLPRGLFALEEVLRFAGTRWAETWQSPAGSRGQGMGTGKVALRRAQPQTKALSDHFPQAPKYQKSFQVCVQRAGLRECHARSQQTAGAAGVVLGGRRSTKESEQTSLQRRLMPEIGKQVYLKNNILLEAVRGGHCAVCETLAALRGHSLS